MDLDEFNKLMRPTYAKWRKQVLEDLMDPLPFWLDYKPPVLTRWTRFKMRLEAAWRAFKGEHDQW